jgi:hypothetical protein
MKDAANKMQPMEPIRPSIFDTLGELDCDWADAQLVPGLRRVPRHNCPGSGA